MRAIKRAVPANFLHCRYPSTVTRLVLLRDAALIRAHERIMR